MRPIEAVVIGAGPAGWAAASALHARGLSVAVVAPAPDDAWAQNFGVWSDELAACGLSDTAAATWGDTWVHATRRVLLGRGYARLDNARLQARLAHPGIQRIPARVSTTALDGASVRIETSNGPLHARVAVEARGAGFGVARAWQSALGFTLDWPGHPFPRGEMGLMDLRDAPGVSPGDPPPTFLYVMPLGADRVFVEETALAARNAVPWDLLEARLAARLRLLGGPALAGPVERCRVPLALTLPAQNPGTVAFGAAAGMIHPATGYHLGGALRLAPALARAVAANLDRGPAAAAAAGEAVVRSPARRRVAQMHGLGLTTLLRMRSSEVRSFFDAFFALPPDAWQAWLDPGARPLAVARAMLTLFVGGGPEVRRLVSRGVVPSLLLAGGSP